MIYCRNSFILLRRKLNPVQKRRGSFVGDLLFLLALIEGEQLVELFVMSSLALVLKYKIIQMNESQMLSDFN